MPERPSTCRPVAAKAVRATVSTAVSGALAAGVHHATTGVSASWPGLALASALLFCCAFVSFHLGTRWAGPAVILVAQVVLPAWLAATENPARATAGHQALPPAWHHNLPAMAALNLVVALLLAWLLRDARTVPSRVVRAVTAPARQWVTRVGALLSVRPTPHLETCRPWHRLPAPELLASQTTQAALRH